MARHLILCGDVREILASCGENEFDACFCDPPYGLEFMGKEWDHGVPSEDTWREVYRVLKPDAMLMAFGGTRTHHRLMCAIEDAGFEVRDCLMWLYGSGFPKSLDVSKAIDKAAEVDRAAIGTKTYADGTQGHWGLSDKYAQDQHTRSLTKGTPKLETLPATPAAKLWSGCGTALKPAWEPIILAMKACEGTFTENALKWGVAGLAIDAGRIGVGGQWKWRTPRGHGWDGYVDAGDGTPYGPSRQGRWPANLLLDEEAAEMLDEQSGEGKSRSGGVTSRTGKGAKYGMGTAPRTGHDDSGGASRFFYCAKASCSEREMGLAGTPADHPTVKPLKLCEYLARLILPPARRTPRALLVPFSGSGSEMIGSLRAGWDHVTGIEISEHYCRIAEARLAEALRV